jgi:hypothetical protein
LLFFAVGAAFDCDCTEVMRWVDLYQRPSPETAQAYDRVRTTTSAAHHRVNAEFGSLILIVTAGGFFIAGRQSARQRKIATSTSSVDATPRT